MKRLYYGRHRKAKANELGVDFHNSLDEFLGKCDVVCSAASYLRLCTSTSFPPKT